MKLFIYLFIRLFIYLKFKFTCFVRTFFIFWQNDRELMNYPFVVFWRVPDSNPDTFHVALAGIGLSHTCHYLSVLSLYGLSRTVFGDGSSRALPLLAAALHVISPAGAFLSAPYGEPVFSFLNFTGFYAYASALHDDRRGCVFARDVKFLVAGGLFATVTTVRSNGVLSGMLFAYDAVVGLAAIVSSGVSLSKLHRMFFVVLGGSLILLGVVGPQYRAFMVYCRNVDVRRIWCDNTIPSVYTFVQNHYWYVSRATTIPKAVMSYTNFTSSLQGKWDFPKLLESI